MTVCYVHNKEIYKSRISLLGKTKRARLWFHDEIYSKCDWTIEPEQSIDDLYKKRAEQLREKYDYLILMFSGGSDSNQVLRSFIDNGIRLDAIHTVFPLKMLKAIETTEYPRNYNLSLLREYNGSVIPRLKKLAITNPEIKVVVHDMTDFIMSNRLSDSFIQDNLQTFIIHNKFNALKSAYQMLNTRYWIDNIPCKVGIIYGVDKPCLFIKDKTLYFKFSDLGRSSPGSYDVEDLNYDPILFYWGHDFPLISIKQSHLIKRYMEMKGSLIVPHRDSSIMKRILYPHTFEPDIYQQPLQVKYTNEQILMFFFGRKECENIEELKKLKIISDSKSYEVGKLCFRQQKIYY